MRKTASLRSLSAEASLIDANGATKPAKAGKENRSAKVKDEPVPGCLQKARAAYQRYVRADFSRHARNCRFLGQAYRAFFSPFPKQSARE